MGLILFGLALSVALPLAAWSLPSPFEGLGRWFVAFTVFFGLYGCIAGVRELLRERRSSPRPANRRENFVAIVIALIGLATAILNLYAAFESIPTTP